MAQEQAHVQPTPPEERKRGANSQFVAGKLDADRSRKVRDLLQAFPKSTIGGILNASVDYYYFAMKNGQKAK